MFLTPRLLRYVRHQSSSSTGSTYPVNALLKPLLTGRCQPLLVIFHRSTIPTVLGLCSRRDHHSGSGGSDKRPASSSAGEKGGKKSGGKGGGGGGGGGGKDDGDVNGASSSGKKDGYKTVSPTAIQVYSDPTLARTVRELSVVLQRTKNHIKNLKEELEDCTFEIIKQSQNQRSFDKMAKEAKTLSSDALEKLTSQKDELSVMEKNLVFFSRMSASHDNQIRDTILRLNDCDRRLDIAVSKLEYVGSSLTWVKTVLNDDVKSELRELRLAINLGKNETRVIREALQREGIDIKSSTALVPTCREEVETGTSSSRE